MRQTIEELKETKAKLKLHQKLTYLMGIITIMLLIYVAYLTNDNRLLTQEVASVYVQLEDKDVQLSEKTDEIIEKHNLVVALQTTMMELDNEIKELSSTNKSYVDELTELRSRSELYDKYNYAIINECGDRTELTYAEIKLGEELMKEKGYNPHLMFGTIMVESGGNPTAVNHSSGSVGYGQFLNSTAEFVWVDIMGNSNYYPEIRKDGVSNIKMMANYYDYLYSTKKNTFGVIKEYSGNSTDAGARQYLSKINNYTRKVGVVIN